MPKLSTRDAVAVIQHVDRLHRLQSNASAWVDQLLQHLASTSPLGTTAQELLFKIGRCTKGPRNIPVEALNKLLSPPYRQSARATTVAQTVFGTPELLEGILINLCTLDLLRNMRVNSTFCDTIETSPTIQRKIGLKADEGCSVRFPLERQTRSLRCTTDGSGMNFFLTRDDKIHISLDYTGHAKLGSRCRRILVCQPPLKALDVYPSCCQAGFFRHQRVPAQSLTSATGITVGDVADEVARVKESHRLCPRAELRCLDDDGFVHVDVHFEAAIEVSLDEPLLVAKKEMLRVGDKRRVKGDAKQARLAPYVLAKRAAHNAGQKIPTLAEFEAARVAQQM